MPFQFDIKLVFDNPPNYEELTLLEGTAQSYNNLLSGLVRRIPLPGTFTLEGAVVFYKGDLAGTALHPMKATHLSHARLVAQMILFAGELLFALNRTATVHLGLDDYEWSIDVPLDVVGSAPSHLA